MTAVVTIRGKNVRRWPAVAIAGKYWAATLPVSALDYKPRTDAPFVCITHQPTGFKAAEVSPKDAQRVANRFAKFFGNARTRRGVMRKYAALTDTEKRWIGQRRYWPTKAGK